MHIIKLYFSLMGVKGLLTFKYNFENYTKRKIIYKVFFSLKLIMYIIPFKFFLMKLHCLLYSLSHGFSIEFRRQQLCTFFLTPRTYVSRKLDFNQFWIELKTFTAVSLETIGPSFSGLARCPRERTGAKKYQGWHWRNYANWFGKEVLKHA